MRALFLAVCATTLLLALFDQKIAIPSAITTASSALVAPYLGQPSGYVRPSVTQVVQQKQQLLLTLARLHNHPRLTKLTDQEFAAIMVTILYTEQLGWLEDAIPSIRPLTPLYQEAQAVSNDYLGTNFSVWPANLRPSVVDEILSQDIPQVGHTEMLLLIPRRMQHVEYANTLAHNDDTAFALLAANLERGILRAQHEHVPITWKTLLAWHNAGIVNPTQIAQNRSLQHYLQRATVYRAQAIALYRDDVACLNPSFAQQSFTRSMTH